MCIVRARSVGVGVVEQTGEAGREGGREKTKDSHSHPSPGAFLSLSLSLM